MPAATRFARRISTSDWRADGIAWSGLFAAIDARDADRFVEYLTEDAEFRFGNSPPVVGRAAIRDAVAGFFAAIAGCRHLVRETWTGSATAVCEGEVSYLRRDGGSVTVPFANVFDLRDGKVSSYRIYIDNGPLFAP